MEIFGVLQFEEDELLHAIQKRNYGRAYALLRKRTEPLMGAAAQKCLEAALGATPRLFQRVLEGSREREYEGQAQLRLDDRRVVHVYGTLLSAAAALDRPEHVRILLEAGYDCNSAGLSTAEGMECSFFPSGDEASPYGDYCGIAAGMIHFCQRRRWSIRYATPLAAAVACGAKKAAAVLMAWPGVWKLESGVVCRAAVSALEFFREDPRQEVAAALLGGAKGAAAEKMAHTCNLYPEYCADFCSARILKAQLEHGFCTETQARHILHVLDESSGRAPLRKVELIGQHYPRLCQEGWVTGILLREIVARHEKNKPCTRLVGRWKDLCGVEGDLTWAAPELGALSVGVLRKLLARLEQGITLTVDADACGSFQKGLTELLSHVQVKHNWGLPGISALAGRVLSMRDLRRARRAVELGAFDGEEPETLLKTMEEKGSHALRPLLLTYGGLQRETETPRWKEEFRNRFWEREWNLSMQQVNDWLEELMNEPLPEEECIRRIQMLLLRADYWDAMCTVRQKLSGVKGEPLVRFMRPEGVLFCARQELPLRLLMEHQPACLRRTYRMLYCTGSLFALVGSPLCLAAATGRTGLVRLLLDSGIHPDERGLGMVSYCEGRNLLHCGVTPVMAAILYGREDTARMLLEAGAQCDFSRPEFHKLLKMGDEQTAALAARLPGTGFDRRAHIVRLEEP